MVRFGSSLLGKLVDSLAPSITAILVRGKQVRAQLLHDYAAARRAVTSLREFAAVSDRPIRLLLGDHRCVWL